MFRKPLVVQKQDGRFLWLYGEREHKVAPYPEGEGALPAASHLRWHPLQEEWVIYAAHRGKGPFPVPERNQLLYSSGSGPSSPRFPFPNSGLASLDWASRWTRAEGME